MNKKSIVFIIAVILLIILSVVIFNNFNEDADVPDATIVDDVATGEVKVEQIEIKDITRVYEDGITTIRAKMFNRTDTVKNVTIKIILKDEQGNELRNMMQVVENLIPNREKVLSTGIAGDFSNVNEIKFEIVE